MENEDHPESQPHAVFIPLFSVFFFSQFFSVRWVQYAKYRCSQSRQIQWSSITHSEIPFLLNMTLAPPSLLLVLNPANIFLSNELWVCCHCPRAERKMCWEWKWHGDEPIHVKRAPPGSKVISRGSWDGVLKKRKVSRMWEARQGTGRLTSGGRVLNWSGLLSDEYICMWLFWQQL